mgnify:CR=1 FL=1
MFEFLRESGHLRRGQSLRGIFDRTASRKKNQSPDSWVNQQLRERFAEVGIETQGGSDEKFTAYVHNELVKWAKVAKEADIKAD